MLVGHKKQWEFLKRKFEQDQLSHAYLFTGAEGIGKKFFAKEFSEFVGCKFPDLKIINQKEDKSEIDIAQIREVQNFLSYKSYNSGYKIVIVDDAEKMNQEAQSCFLKTLEEPKGQTLLILVSSKPDMFLQTISSRCQAIKFFKPKNLPVNAEKIQKEQEILAELLPVMNSTLADKFKYTKSLNFEKYSAGEILKVMQKYFRKQLLDNFSDPKAKRVLELSDEISQKLLFTNANQKLALEIILMEI